jgi:lipopolysaccharide transport system permease protein
MQEEKWTKVIEPKGNWLDLKLKEVWDYRDLIIIFVRRDIVSIYKQTILGPLWFFLGPLFTVATFTLVFQNIANISTDGVPAPIFYLAGTTLWNYFSACFGGSSSVFLANAGIFGKVYFPRLVAPISQIIANLLKFFIQLLMFAVFWLYYFFRGEISINEYALLLPLLLLIMALMALGVGIIISSLTTKYRDLTYFIGFGLTLLMYATPIIYPASSIPESYQPYLKFNPLSPIIETFRFGFTGGGTFTWEGILFSTAFTIVVLFFGIVLFNKTERTFMDTV